MTRARERYAQSTRRALLDAARDLFVAQAYADLSAETLVEAAGLSRGALYHHFDGKQGLFEAVFDEFERAAAQRVQSAIEGGRDPLDRAERGILEFLDVCAGESYRHVVLLQGPLALGWSKWRAIDQHHLGGIVVAALAALADSGQIRPHRVELLAAAFYGSLTELSMIVAESEDPHQARIEAVAVQRDLLYGLRAAPWHDSAEAGASLTTGERR